MHGIQGKQEVRNGSKRTSTLSNEVVTNLKWYYYAQL